MPSANSDLPPPQPLNGGEGVPPGPRETARRGTRGGLRAAVVVLVSASGIALAGWMIAAYLARPQAVAPEMPDPPAGAQAARAAADLASDHYNAVLQVRLKDERGEASAVGTLLARKLTLILTDAAGRTYAEVFDRVGLWAIEVPPGAYLIPFDQSDLAHWKWSLAGDALRKVAGKGYAVTFTAGRVNPTIDLLLQ